MTTKESDCKISDPINIKKHWDSAYIKKDTTELGWYERSAQKTIDLINKTGVSKDASILNVGVGSSVIVDELLKEGFTNLIANDFSDEALIKVKSRLGVKAKEVLFVVDDLLNATTLNKLKDIEVWNDRAVLHFFLKPDEQITYFNLLKQVVKQNGFVIIAVFSLDGAKKCCGLPLQLYDEKMLQEKLGEDFKLIDNFKHTFINPNGGERPYVYTLFQRINK